MSVCVLILNTPNPYGGKTLSEDTPTNLSSPDNPTAADARALIDELVAAVNRKVLGQEMLVNSLINALLCNGHVLVEGPPGVAKTRVINSLMSHMDGEFKKIQFTPDLLPADLTGTEMLQADSRSFEFVPGPVFCNLLLADEINRAPAKVQSALLEAMQERAVTAGRQTRQLDEPFLVMATQNPIEQQGTFPLPEAQLDRFHMKILVGHPTAQAERDIVTLVTNEINHPDSGEKIEKKLTLAHIQAARHAMGDLFIAQDLQRYIVELVRATREPESYVPELAGMVQYGASVRATIALSLASRAYAWLNNRDFVTPEDVMHLAPNVLRHRIGMTFEATALGWSADRAIEALLRSVPLP